MSIFGIYDGITSYLISKDFVSIGPRVCIDTTNNITKSLFLMSPVLSIQLYYGMKSHIQKKDKIHIEKWLYF